MTAGGKGEEKQEVRGSRKKGRGEGGMGRGGRKEEEVRE